MVRSGKVFNNGSWFSTKVLGKKLNKELIGLDNKLKTSFAYSLKDVVNNKRKAVDWMKMMIQLKKKMVCRMESIVKDEKGDVGMMKMLVCLVKPML